MALSPAYLEKMVIKVRSPDGRIFAKLEYPEDATLEFRPGAYEGYDARTLEHQLSRLATLLWTGYRKGRSLALRKITGETAAEHPEAQNANDRRYEEALAAIVSQAVSPSGLIKLVSVGLASWDARIKDDAFAQATEGVFLAETKSAVDALVHDHWCQMIMHQDKFYGLCIPASWRDEPPRPPVPLT